jgi:hypothetical protein
MVRRVSGADNAILSCYDEEQYYTNDNVIHVILWTSPIHQLQSPGDYEISDQVGNYDLRYIAAKLNSRLVTYYFAHFLATDTLQGSYTGVYPEDVRKLPIRRISFTMPQEERARLREIGITEAAEMIGRTEGVSVASLSLSAFSDSTLGRWLNARLPTNPNGSPDAEHEQSDVVHDLLAHLAEQMIGMHKAKNEEVRGFLDWLAGYTGLPIEDWTLKTNLKTYYQHDWAEMQRILSGNRRRIRRVDVEGREAQERIQREHQASVGKLQPLLARIAATDRLIDLIVYRLYGLNEEEVKVVEGQP